MPQRKGKPSLDELFELKRSEKPSPEFWERFDRELSLKQRRLLLEQPLDDEALGQGAGRGLRHWLSWGGAALCLCCAAALLAPRFLESDSAGDAASPSDIANLSVASAPPQGLGAPRRDPIASSLDETARSFRGEEAGPPNRSRIAMIEIPLPSERETPTAKPRERVSGLSPRATAVAQASSGPAGARDSTASSATQKRWEELLSMALATTRHDSRSFASKAPPSPAPLGVEDIVARYEHPLKEFGYGYEQTRRPASAAPLEQLSSLARQSLRQEESSRWGIRLDAISLKF